jgi:hypothetical protein
MPAAGPLCEMLQPQSQAALGKQVLFLAELTIFSRTGPVQTWQLPGSVRRLEPVCAPLALLVHVALNATTVTVPGQDLGGSHL